jgi:hypothetical protein
MGINIRQKGAEGERQVAKALNEVIGAVLREQQWSPEIIAGCEQCVQRNQNQSAVGGCDLSNVFGLAIEVKRQEQLSVNTWWSQCVASAERNREFPVLVYRQNRQAWRVVMYGVLVLPILNDGAEDRFGGARTGLSSRVEVAWEDFLNWFHAWVVRKLANGEYPRV